LERIFTNDKVLLVLKVVSSVTVSSLQPSVSLLVEKSWIQYE